MKRTQIYLPEALHSRILALSRTKKVSFAEVIRGLLEKHLDSEEKASSNGLLELATLNIRGGPKDLSKKFKDYRFKDE